MGNFNQNACANKLWAQRSNQSQVNALALGEAMLGVDTGGNHPSVYMALSQQ